MDSGWPKEPLVQSFSCWRQCPMCTIFDHICQVAPVYPATLCLDLYKNGWTDILSFGLWTRVDRRKHFVQLYSPDGANMPTWECTFVPLGEYDWTVRLPGLCSLMSNYFDHLLNFGSVVMPFEWLKLDISNLALCDFDMQRLRRTLTYFLTYRSLCVLVHAWLITPKRAVFMVKWLLYCPFPSNRHHQSDGNGLEGKRENYQVCFWAILCATIVHSAMHTHYEQT